MDNQTHLLTAQQYNLLYCRAFARLDDISRQAEQAMKELEELQLALAETPPSAPALTLFPHPERTQDTP